MCNEDELYEILEDLIFAFSLLSGVASAVIVALYAVFSELRGPSFRILFFMSATDIVRSIALALPTNWQDIKEVCSAIGLVTNATISVNAIWSVNIFFLLHQIYKHYPDMPQLYDKTWLISAFLIAPILQFLPLLTDSYGKNQGTCTYTRDKNAIIWRSVHYSFIVIMIFFSILLSIRDYYKLHHLKIITVHQVVFEKGMIYSIIFLITMTVIMIYRYTEIGKSFCRVYVLAFFSYSLLSLHGFFNFLALMFNRNFRLVICSQFTKNHLRYTSEEIISSLISDEINNSS